MGGYRQRPGQKQEGKPRQAAAKAAVLALEGEAP